MNCNHENTSSFFFVFVFSWSRQVFDTRIVVERDYWFRGSVNPLPLSPPLSVMAALTVGLLLAEARRASRNERAQRARGGVEPADDVYRIMRVAYPGAFLAMFVEGAVRGAPPAAVLVTGAVVFAAAKSLKWWAILSLGPFWTFRVIVVPGVPLIAKGPYRWLRHPNYVAVMGELAGVAAVTGAPVSGSVAVVAFGALLIKRIAVEERALRTSRTAAR
jgi:methyltransferase